jgi:hypothetical protein
MSRESGILAEFKHVRKVGIYSNHFPKWDPTPPPDFDGGYAGNHFPVYIQLILSGAKIFPRER